LSKITFMDSHLLLPNAFKRIGWILLVPATIAGIFLAIQGFDAKWINTKVFAIFFDSGIFSHTQSFGWTQVDATNTLIGAVWLMGGMMVSFSKEKQEDEFISNLRLSSLLWAVWVNFILLLLAFIFIYGSPFFNVMVYNMFTILIIFIARFNFILYRNSKMTADEK